MTPLWPDAWQSVKRNREPVLLYLGSLFLFTLAINALEMYLGIDPKHRPDWLPAYQFALTLMQAVIFSAIVSIVFARIGEDIDRPLWRCPSDREALQRFFVPWLIIHLLILTTIQLTARAVEAEQQDLAGFLLILFLFLQATAIPLGACIMYLGRFRWSELGVALKPLFAFPELLLQVLLAAALQSFLFLIAQSLMPALDEASPFGPFKAQVLYWPLVALPINLFDVLIFAMVWRICMIHRDEGIDEADPFDF